MGINYLKNKISPWNSKTFTVHLTPISKTSAMVQTATRCSSRTFAMDQTVTRCSSRTSKLPPPCTLSRMISATKPRSMIPTSLLLKLMACSLQHALTMAGVSKARPSTKRLTTMDTHLLLKLPSTSHSTWAARQTRLHIPMDRKKYTQNVLFVSFYEGLMNLCDGSDSNHMFVL